MHPSSIILFINELSTCVGSLYGNGKILSLIAPLGTSTSRNSPGAIGVSSPLMRSPRELDLLEGLIGYCIY